MVTAGQKGEIFPRRMTLGKCNIYPIWVREQRPEVLATPRNVVASHDELDARKAFDEVARGAPQIARRRGGKALSDFSTLQEVTSTNVDGYSNEGRTGPACRYVGGQEAGRKLAKFESEFQLVPQCVGDGIRVPKFGLSRV